MTEKFAWETKPEEQETETAKPEWYVTSTDSFMSGWGGAKGKINKVYVPCASYAEAERVAAYASSRREQKYVSIAKKVNLNKQGVVWSKCEGWLDRADEIYYRVKKHDLIEAIKGWAKMKAYEVDVNSLWKKRIASLKSLYYFLQIDDQGEVNSPDNVQARAWGLTNK